MSEALNGAARDLLRFPDLTVEIIERLPDGLLMVELADPGRVLYANPSALLLTGYSRGQLYALPSVDELVPEEMRAAHSGFRAAFRADPSVRSMGTRPEGITVRARSGERIPADVMLVPLSSPVGSIVVAILRRRRGA